MCLRQIARKEWHASEQALKEAVSFALASNSMIISMTSRGTMVWLNAGILVEAVVMVGTEELRDDFKKVEDG